MLLFFNTYFKNIKYRFCEIIIDVQSECIINVFVLKLDKINMSYRHSFEVVDRVSETQLKMNEIFF